MSKLTAIAKSFVAGEEGATMVEYGLMVALIAAVCIAVVTTLGTNIQAKFQSVSDAIGG
jgi:pilus assembly protein Flp/PilA